MHHAQTGVRILEAAIAFAGRGEMGRARDLVARVTQAADADTILMDQRGSEILIAAWSAIGELDRALAHERTAVCLAPGAISPIAVRLGELGRSQEALALVGAALDRVAEWTDLLALAPAVLAVSADPRAAAAAMLDAWRATEAGLDAFDLAPQHK
jgi:hypothetical protein